MANLKGSKTEENLKAAFAGESQANRRYLYFAQKADVEGYNDVAVVFRSTAEGETGHAHGHLEFLEVSGDPATGLPIGPTDSNLKAAIAGGENRSSACTVTTTSVSSGPKSANIRCRPSHAGPGRWNRARGSSSSRRRNRPATARAVMPAIASASSPRRSHTKSA